MWKWLEDLKAQREGEKTQRARVANARFKAEQERLVNEAKTHINCGDIGAALRCLQRVDDSAEVAQLIKSYLKELIQNNDVSIGYRSNGHQIQYTCNGQQIVLTGVPLARDHFLDVGKKLLTDIGQLKRARVAYSLACERISPDELRTYADMCAKECKFKEAIEACQIIRDGKAPLEELLTIVMRYMPHPAREPVES